MLTSRSVSVQRTKQIHRAFVCRLFSLLLNKMSINRRMVNFVRSLADRESNGKSFFFIFYLSKWLQWLIHVWHSHNEEIDVRRTQKINERVLSLFSDSVGDFFTVNSAIIDRWRLLCAEHIHLSCVANATSDFNRRLVYFPTVRSVFRWRFESTRDALFVIAWEYFVNRWRTGKQ